MDLLASAEQISNSSPAKSGSWHETPTSFRFRLVVPMMTRRVLNMIKWMSQNFDIKIYNHMTKQQTQICIPAKYFANYLARSSMKLLNVIAFQSKRAGSNM